jgi:hypothetical protein
MEILPVGTEFFRADGHTDMKKLVVAFRNFVNAFNLYRTKVTFAVTQVKI